MVTIPPPSPEDDEQSNPRLNFFASILKEVLARHKKTLWTLSPTETMSRIRQGNLRPDYYIWPSTISRILRSMERAGSYPTLPLQKLKVIARESGFSAAERREVIASLLVTAVQAGMTDLLGADAALSVMPLAQELYKNLLKRLEDDPTGLSRALDEKGTGMMATPQDVLEYDLDRALASYDEAVMTLSLLDSVSFLNETPEEESKPSLGESSATQVFSPAERMRRLRRAQKACEVSRDELEFFTDVEKVNALWRESYHEVTELLDQIAVTLARLHDQPPSR